MGLSSEHAAQQPGDELWDPSWQPSHGEETIRQRSNAKAESSSADSPPVTLYTSWFCPFAQRAWIALEEKGVNYHYVEINPYEVDAKQPGGYTKQALPLEEKRRAYPDFIAASPRGLVPAVEHAAYVDEAFPAARSAFKLTPDVSNAGSVDLLPRGDSNAAALQRAQLRIWADHCTERIWKGFYVLLFSQGLQRQEAGKAQLIKESRTLANAMAPTEEGPFFLGQEFSFVEVALAPMWQRILWIGGHYRGLVLPDAETDSDFARLARWWGAVCARPSVAATLVCKERLIASYAQYADNTATSDVAKQTQSKLHK